MNKEKAEYTKEELYAHAKEHNMFVCGDPNCVDEETKVDYSHVSFLEETGQITHREASQLTNIWPSIWHTLENFMDKLVMSGEDAKDLKQENVEWKESYEHIATELRLARRYLALKPKREIRFHKYRTSELGKLQKEMAKQIKDYEANKLEKENEKITQED